MASNYTQATAQQVINGMSQKTGLSPALVQVWLEKENGCCNNPFGANSFRGDDGLMHNRPYPTLADGIQANANLLNQAGYYANVRANRGRSTLAQAYALAASPWGPTGAYFASFPNMGLPIVKGHPPADWSSANAPAGAVGGTPITGPAPSTGGSVPTAGTADQWNAAIACFTAKHPVGVTRTAPRLAAADLPDLVACAHTNGITITVADLQPYVGKTLSDVRDGLAARGVIPPADPGAIVPDIAGAVTDAIGASLGAVVPLVVGAGILLVVVGLTIGGTKDVLGGN